MNRFYKLFIFILPALVTFLVYIPALGAGFVNWDDPKYVYENPYITELDAFFFKFAFTSFYFANWHPLTLISYAVDYALWGDRPFGYHLTNNLLHSVNTGLVALLAFRLTSLSSAKHGSRTVPIAAALISAALFGLHPIHVESAAWISERKDLLCALFLFLAALSYLRYAPSGKIRWYGASLFFFALSLMSKPMAITFPFILLILDFYPLERIRVALGRILIEKLPFLALSAASAILTMLAQKGEGALTALGPILFLMRAAVALRGLAFYIFKTVFPAGLAPFYPLHKDALFDSYLLASVAVAAAIAIVSIAALKRTKAIAAAWLYYVITLLPVLGLLQAGGQAAADRYSYLPLVGPFMLAGAGASMLLERIRERRAVFYPAVAAIFFIIVALSALTVRQMGFWKDSIALWNRQIALYPDGVSNTYNLRGLAYSKAGMHLEAIADFNRVLAINPENFFAYNNRGNAFKALGDFGQAIHDFQKAAAINPGLPDSYVNLSKVYYLTGETELAFEARKKADALKRRR